jgi:hypothetical protein
MAQRSDEVIITAYNESMGHLPVKGLDLEVVPVPTAMQSEVITLEVLLDIRETMNKILALLGGTP